MPEPRALTVAGAARFLGVHPNTVRAWSDRGQLPCLRINRRGDRRFPVSALREFLARAERAGMRPVRGDVTAVAVTAPRTVAAPGTDARDHLRPDEVPAPIGAVEAIDPAFVAALQAPRSAGIGGISDDRGGSPVATSAADRLSVDLRVLGHIVRLTSAATAIDGTLSEVAAVLRAALGASYVSIVEATPDGLLPRGSDGLASALPPGLVEGGGLAGRAIAGRQVAFVPAFQVPRAFEPNGFEPGAASDPGSGSEPGTAWSVRTAIALPVLLDDEPWGALTVETDQPETLGPQDVPFLEAVGVQLAGFVERLRTVEGFHRQLDRAEAVQRVAAGLAGKLDPRDILRGLLDHTVGVFSADRGAVLLQSGDGTYVVEATRNLAGLPAGSDCEFPEGTLPERAARLGQPLAIEDGRDHRHGLPRAMLPASYTGAVAAAPLLAERDLVGLLLLVRDAARPFDAADLDAMGVLTAQVGIAVRNARTFTQMATWAAQLRSVQQLGGRISGLVTAADIGRAVATELRLVIDAPLVRVYRVLDGGLLPIDGRQQAVATATSLANGQGLVGWIARSGIAEMVADIRSDTRADPAAEAWGDSTSALVAPLTFESRNLGAIVLGRPAPDAFTDDELRLLVIYSTFVAQALANAEATERLEAQSAKLSRQLRSQQELLGITESILATLDPRIVVEQVADRLGALVRYDGLVIRIVNGSPGTLRPIVVRGPDGGRLEPDAAGPGDDLATQVLERGEGLLLPGIPDSRILVPLRGHERIVGVLALERRDPATPFTQDEFELVTLFAAQASIALRNAEVHRAVEIQAETDAVTGLRNHGTFKRQLAAAIARRDPFALLMLDLDGFKRYNDTFGHPAGDELLRRIATTLRGSVRESDVVFRYGGDEFSLLLPRTDSRGSLAVANKVIRAVRVAGEADRNAPTPVRVTCSIGVAAFPADGGDLDAVLLAADRACYASKRSGRDRVSTAADGLALAGEFLPTSPTPVDSQEPETSRA